MIHPSLELIASSLGIVNVYLVVRNHIWNWLFGIVSISLYLIIFFNVKLYADMGLQIVFLILQFYGIYEWKYGGINAKPLLITQMTLMNLLKMIPIFIILTSSISYLLITFTDSTTYYIDALTTSLSLIAQYMMIKKWREHWLLWIVIDVISVGMYIGKHLYLTSALYSLLMLMSVMGYFQWKKYTA